MRNSSVACALQSLLSEVDRDPRFARLVHERILAPRKRVFLKVLERAAERGLDSLRSKFHNMGLEVDDIIKEGNAFDGFTPVEEGEILPSVDTVG